MCAAGWTRLEMAGGGQALATSDAHLLGGAPAELHAFMPSWAMLLCGSKGQLLLRPSHVVLASEAAAAAVRQRHRERPFIGVFEVGGVAVKPLVVQPDRERWRQNLLTLLWPVLGFLRRPPAVKDATMGKHRVDQRRHARIQVKKQGKEVLRPVGTAERRVLSEDGPEPNERVSFSASEGRGEVARGIRAATGWPRMRGSLRPSM